MLVTYPLCGLRPVQERWEILHYYLIKVIRDTIINYLLFLNKLLKELERRGGRSVDYLEKAGVLNFPGKNYYSAKNIP